MNMIRMLRGKNKVLQERLKTHTIVIPAEGDNRNTRPLEAFHLPLFSGKLNWTLLSLSRKSIPS